ncbi:MAG TPA: hypothetical protein VFP65_10150 [Anaeromyxobacteraceae bacterium]|nr:hypothetical protein [Anaeromyxobacteraceae bacterium]
MHPALPALRTSGRLVASAAVLAPFAVAVVLLAREARQRPSGRTALATGSADGAIPLPGGAIVDLRLPSVREGYRELQVTAVTAGSTPRVDLAVCAGARCAPTTLAPTDGASASLALPRGVKGGPVEVRVASVQGGTFALSAAGGVPLVFAVHWFSWRFPLRRAAAVFAAGGIDGFAASGLAWMAVLAAVAALAVARLRRRGSGRTVP